jgi:general secretion pathway protein I
MDCANGAERMDARERPQPPAPIGGFTLIEVLAALVIVALGMMAVIQAVSQTASNSTYLREKTIAHWVALNQLTETRLQQTPPKIDETSDEVEMAGREWRWTMTVTQTPVESMRRIDISVRPADAAEESSMASITGFYGSAIAPPGSALIDWDALTPAPGQPGDPGDERDGDLQPGEEPPPRDDAGDEQPDEEPQDQITDPPSDEPGGEN